MRLSVNTHMWENVCALCVCTFMYLCLWVHKCKCEGEHHMVSSVLVLVCCIWIVCLCVPKVYIYACLCMFRCIFVHSEPCRSSVLYMCLWVWMYICICAPVCILCPCKQYMCACIHIDMGMFYFLLSHCPVPTHFMTKAYPVRCDISPDLFRGFSAVSCYDYYFTIINSIIVVITLSPSCLSFSFLFFCWSLHFFLYFIFFCWQRQELVLVHRFRICCKFQGRGLWLRVSWF